MKEVAKKTSYYVGIQNWILIFSVVCVINYSLGTWKYNNISDRSITPSEFFELFIHYIRSHFRSFILLLLCVLLQSILSFIIEKALINNYVSESAGLTYHLINCLLPTNFTLVSSSLVYIDPCTRFFVTIHVVHITFFKEISYTFVNSGLRKEWRKSMKETLPNNDKKDIRSIYPQNINLKKTLLYWFATPIGIYKPDVPHIINLNLARLRIGLVKIIISTYISLNILYIFIIPEVQECVRYIEKGVLLETFKCFIRLLIPVHLLWLIGVYYFALVAISETWFKVIGHSTNIEKDWWNSTTVFEFWTKWNYYVHEWYRVNVFKPLVTSGISSEHATVIVFAFSGLLHVFFLEVPFRIYNSTSFIGMLLQIPQNDISSYLKKNYGPRISNCYVLLQFIIFQPLFAILFYYNYNRLSKN